VKKRVLAILAAAAAFAVPVAQAHAATTELVAAASSNWAGYAVASSDPATPLAYSGASGAWIQPAATCTPGSQTFSAFWVGLGGLSDASQALEQIGTESDCTASGLATYSVWYELVPAAPVTVKLKVGVGDKITASVAVSGQLVTVKLRNLTRKTSFTKRLTMPVAPDVSSAEWIAEAPSTCTSSGDCVPLPLTNFGTVPFSSARATTSGYIGTISDPAWGATAIVLQGSGGFLSRRFGGMATAADATPSDLSPTGGAFSVTWSQSDS
jgi:hypothetical protein